LPSSSRPSSRSPKTRNATPETDADVTGRRPLQVQRLGVVPYGEALELQAELVEKRRRGEIPDQLLLLEHPHVKTLGRSSHTDHILLSDDELRLLGIDLFETGRGGDVTYHGPGQLIGYPILDLKPDRCDLHRYVRDLEEVLIQVVQNFGIAGSRRQGMTGVWAGERKIVAIGVRVSSGWITSHGFAVNVSNDLRFFDSIVPCGIREFGVTSIHTEAGAKSEIDPIDEVITSFEKVFDFARMK
jgi:lipoyl(octanoyl) transferase